MTFCKSFFTENYSKELKPEVEPEPEFKVATPRSNHDTECRKPSIDFSSDCSQTPNKTYKPQFTPPNMPINPQQTPFKQFPDVLHQADGFNQFGALILQPSNQYDTASLSSMQFVLMTPQHGVTTMPIMTPQHTLNYKNTVSTNTECLTENRVLTPTKYRSHRSNCRDIGTQTEKLEIDRPKYGSLDRQISRKHRERRQRSEDRISTDRPKWGVNRPPTQYLTQSEKDPLYQRRKLRQKLKELNKDSSDESRSASPINSTKTTPQHDRRLHYNFYQTEIVPIEADARGRLYVGQKSSQSSRRQSISEKFLLAKQKREQKDERKTRLNKHNEKQRDEGYWVESAEVLTQLSNLKNRLKSYDSPRSEPLDIDTDI